MAGPANGEHRLASRPARDHDPRSSHGRSNRPTRCRRSGFRRPPAHRYLQLLRRGAACRRLPLRPSLPGRARDDRRARPRVRRAGHGTADGRPGRSSGRRSGLAARTLFRPPHRPLLHGHRGVWSRCSSTASSWGRSSERCSGRWPRRPRVVGATSLRWARCARTTTTCSPTMMWPRRPSGCWGSCRRPRTTPPTSPGREAGAPAH